MPRVMQRSYSVKSSNLSNGPGPNVPMPATASARALPAGVTAGTRPFGGLDDERRVAERARAPLVTQERLLFRRAILATLLLARALVEFLGRQRLARALIFGPVARDAAHVVDAPLAFETRLAPRRARRLPLRILDERRVVSAGIERSLLGVAPGPSPMRPPSCAHAEDDANAAIKTSGAVFASMARAPTGADG